MEAKLCFIGHALMENRHGLLIDTRLTRVSGHAERLAALDMIASRADRPSGDHAGRRQGLRRSGLRDGAAREINVTPHIARNTSRRSAIDVRTTRHPGYAISQRIRKRIEEGFGWMKTVAGLRKTKYRGLDKVGWTFTFFAAAAYNLIRLPEADDGAGLMKRESKSPLWRSRSGAAGGSSRWTSGTKMPSTWSSRALSHSTARKARCDSSPCAPGSTFATAAVMAFPSPSSPGRASTRHISVLDGDGLSQRTRAAFTAISSSTMVTIQASPASPR